MVHYTTGLQRHCWYADRWRTKTKATTGAEPHAGLRALVQEQESTHVFRHHLSNHVLAEVWTVRVLYLHFWSGLVQSLDSVRDRDGHALTLPLLVLSNKIASFFYFFFFFFLFSPLWIHICEVTKSLEDESLNSWKAIILNERRQEIYKHGGI